MAASDSPGRTVDPGGPTTDDLVDFRCAHCAAGLTVDSPTYEDVLANGCPVCGTPADAGAFSRRDVA